MLLNVDLYWESWRYLSSIDPETRVTSFKQRPGDVLELQLRFELLEINGWPYGKLNNILSWRFATFEEHERLGLSPKIMQLQPFGSLSYICGKLRDISVTQEATPSERPIRITIDVLPERPAKYVALDLP